MWSLVKRGYVKATKDKKKLITTFVITTAGRKALKENEARIYQS